ncbi:MAG: hypothetical protein AB7F59_10185 [Bdellovibrionales bacterium]
MFSLKALLALSLLSTWPLSSSALEIQMQKEIPQDAQKYVEAAMELAAQNSAETEKPTVVVLADNLGRIEPHSMVVSFIPETTKPTQKQQAQDNYPTRGMSGVEVGGGAKGGAINYMAIKLGLTTLKQSLEVMGSASISPGATTKVGYGWGGVVNVAPLAFAGIRSVYVNGRYMYIMENDGDNLLDFDAEHTHASGLGLGFRKRIKTMHLMETEKLYGNIEAGRSWKSHKPQAGAGGASSKTRGWYFIGGFTLQL